ncbi:hypothetical protein EXIGLDRAFT_335455 [Exidia glandulosa HHB12029]|uniref:Uncharacterized protein n=1 Tax=Exidia glandulosa HHB12029 TaxID=1314781 RepID=A0A165CMN0_EXIGL|nr:hypothetical protein EXIGLDRAFT_335455 [Exidia glandulosa HHB12029]
MFIKSLIVITFVTSVLGAACSPEQLALHGVGAGLQQTAPFSRWETVPDTNGNEVAIFDTRGPDAQALCTFDRVSAGIPPLVRRKLAPLVGAKRAPDCLGDPCTNAQACIDEGCANGCATWTTPGYPGEPGQGLNTACISDGV